MQQNKIKKQKSKNSHKQSSQPSSNNPSQLTPLPKINLSTTNNCMHNNNNSKSKSRYDTHHKRSIITLSNAIVKPHTMMIKSTYTSITTSAVLARCYTITIAEFTVEYLVVLWCKCYLFVMTGPFIVVYQSISWIGQR